MTIPPSFSLTLCPPHIVLYILVLFCDQIASLDPSVASLAECKVNPYCRLMVHPVGGNSHQSYILTYLRTYIQFHKTKCWSMMENLGKAEHSGDGLLIFDN